MGILGVSLHRVQRSEEFIVFAVHLQLLKIVKKFLEDFDSSF